MDYIPLQAGLLYKLIFLYADFLPAAGTKLNGKQPSDWYGRCRWTT